MENLTLSLISTTYLFAFGLLLIALEMISFTFVLFWFGVGFMVVALLTYFNLFDDGLWQIGVASIIAILLLFTLRAKAMKLFLATKGHKHKDNFLDEVGEGVIKDNKVYYKATFWDIDSSEKFLEGEKVKVLSAHKNKAKIEKLHV